MLNFNQKGRVSAVLTALLLTTPLAMAQNLVVGGAGQTLQTRDLGKTWQVKPSGQNVSLNGVFRWNDSTIFIGGGTQVFRSIDNGNTFQQVGQKGSVTVKDMAIFPNGRGYTHFSNYSTHPINSLVSTNFGATWEDNNNGYNAGTALDAAKGTNVAYGAFENGRQLFRTANGGQTWSNVFQVVSFRDVVKTDSAVIVVGDQGRAFISRNNGNSFQPLALPNITTNIDLRSINKAPNGDTVIVGGTNGYVARSTNGGISWTATQVGHRFGTGNTAFTTIRTVYWLNNQTVFLGSENSNANYPMMYRSNDGGITFDTVSRLAYPTNRGRSVRNVFSIMFANDSVGYMSGGWRSNSNENSIYKTTDRGNTWVATEAVPQNNRNNPSLWVWSESEAIVGGSGTFGDAGWDITTNSGQSWTRTVNNRDGGKWSMLFMDRLNGYTAAENGIWKTTNGGVNWTQNTSNPSLNSPLYALKDGFAVGAFGKVFRTTDYETYEEIAPLGYLAGVFNDVQAKSADTVFVAGENGAVFRSYDAGNSWQFIGDTLKRSTIRGVYFPSVQYGWAVTQDGKVYSTADSAKTWAEAQVTSRRLNDVYFLNNQVGVIVGDSGLVLQTMNGGQSWAQVYAGSRVNLMEAWLGDTINQPSARTIAFKSDTVEGFNGETILVPVNAKGFANIRRFQGSLSFDTSLVAYVGPGPILVPGMAASSIVSAANANLNGQVRFSFNSTSTAGVSVVASDPEEYATLFNLSFRLKRADASASVSFNGLWQLGAADSTLTTITTNSEGGLIRAKANPTLATGATLVNGIATTSVCAGQAVAIPFLVSEMLPAGNTFQVQAQRAGTLTWQNLFVPARAGQMSDTLRFTIPDSIRTGTFAIRVVSSLPAVNGIPATEQITINAIPARPTITVGGPQAICPDDSLQLTAPDGFAGYVWSTGETTRSIFVRTAGQYNVAVVSAAGCQSVASANITTTVAPRPAQPTITFTGSTTRCEGETVTLTAPNANAWRWSNGETTRTINVTASGSYTVAVRTTATGCFSLPSQEATFVFNTVPAVPTIVRLGGDTLQATGSSATTYAWFRNNVLIPGATEAKYVFTQPGTYTARAVNQNCQSAASVGFIVTSVAAAKATMAAQIFPNPNAGSFSTRFNANAEGVIEVLDLTGKLVYSERWNTLGEQQIDVRLGNVAKGTYLVRLIPNGTAATIVKMVVE